jgi:hypothetical protein
LEINTFYWRIYDLWYRTFQKKYKAGKFW